MAVAISAILCVASGILIVALAQGRTTLRITNLLFRLCLGTGFGIGLVSVIYFLALVSKVMALWRIELGLFALLLAGYFIVRRARRPNVPYAAHESKPASHLTAIFSIALAAAVYAAIVRAFQRPYGSGWDSFAIWNLHARFLYRGGAAWRDGFSPLIPWSHPDYPLLVPGAVAHFWTMVGHETTAVPTVLGLVFTFITVGLLFSALDILNGRTSALLGGTALLCTPFFVELGTWQYADVPLSFYMLATVVLFQMADSSIAGKSTTGALAMSGLAAGFAAWTKNEGMLFLSSILLARILFRLRRQGSVISRSGASEMVPVLFSILPLYCVIAYFKRAVAPPGDLFSSRPIMLHKLSDPSRYWAVIQWYGKEFLRFGHWLLIPVPLLMLALYAVVRKSNSGQTRHNIAASVWALGLTLTGYFVIYLITPHEIYWHLRFSLNRLFMQIWPSAIFLFFLKIRLQEADSVQESAE